MENSIKGFEEDKKSWQGLNRKISTLKANSRKLFGFENPFSEKTVDSSNERILTATATRDATSRT